MGVIAVPWKAPNHPRGEDGFCVQQLVKEVRPDLNLEGHVEMTRRGERSGMLNR